MSPIHPDTDIKITAAPRRAVPLTAPPPKPATPPADRKAGRSVALKSMPREKLTGVEGKILGMYDAQEMLRVLETEAVLRRARRESQGDSPLKALRVLVILVFFTLLIAALGAMSYLQNKLTQRGVVHRPPPPVVSPSGPAPR